MKRIIEEAIIVETYEIEPIIEIETITPVVIKEKSRSRGHGLIDSLFNLFFDGFGLFGLEDNLYEYNNSQPKEEYIEPEIAIIVETDEIPVKEITEFYVEIY